MTEKRFKLYEHKDNDYILDNPHEHLDFIEMLGDALTSEEIVDLLNKLHEEIQKCKEYNGILYANHTKTDRGLVKQISELKKENEQLKSDKEHLMGCLIRFFGYDDEDIDYNLNRESNREYGKQYYSMKEETKKELEE